MENTITYQDEVGSAPTKTQQITRPAGTVVPAPVRPVADAYTVKTGSNGRVLYFKNGHLVALRNIPEGAIIRDVDGQPVEKPKVEVKTLPSTHKCLYDDEEGEFERFVSGQKVYLCTEHYTSKSLGKIVQKLRESNAV